MCVTSLEAALHMRPFSRPAPTQPFRSPCGFENVPQSVPPCLSPKHPLQLPFHKESLPSRCDPPHSRHLFHGKDLLASCHCTSAVGPWCRAPPLQVVLCCRLCPGSKSRPHSGR